LGVVRRDATTAMPQQVPAVLERHTRSPQPAAESVSEIANARLPIIGRHLLEREARRAGAAAAKRARL
jgi:hypothetical protein